MRGRGAHTNPPNRFESVRQEADWEQLPEEDLAAALADEHVVYLPDASQSIVTENDSPDVPFRYSVNPYRGCQHGCSYCYARPTHEYLGLSAGIDFERKIIVKHQAAELFRRFLAQPGWDAQPVAFSGVTDCYQPAERQFRLTRACLEVALECRQPVGIVTKNALLLRDLDLLQEMAARRLVHVYLSLTTLDAALARNMEPRTSTPAARLRAMETLASAQIPVGAMLAPIIPGLNDREIPALVAAAADAGATAASYVLLRLPLAVQPVFLDWLKRTLPDAKERIVGLIRATRGGALNDAKFGSRMRGAGPIADQIGQLFRTFCRKHGLARSLPPCDSSQFRPPAVAGQLRLF
jgi:DNA repair photolyase